MNKNKLKRLAKLNKKKAAIFALSSALLLSGCNKTIFDTKYGYNEALVFGNDTSLVMDISEWNDYKGEQIELATDDGFQLLTSSFDTKYFYGMSEELSADDIATASISENGEVYRLNEDDGKSAVFNKVIFDTHFSFNKAIIFNGNKAVIVPIYKWKDFQGEQLQVITTDGMVLILSSYNTKLVNDQKSKIKADYFAQCYLGKNGIVTDFSNNPKALLNYDFIDTQFYFNKAIVLKDNGAVILPVSKWTDYEGEQLQLKVTDGPTIVTASYDTIAVDDSMSERKAIDVAKCLTNEPVKDYGKDTKGGLFNKTLIDLVYGFSNAIISNGDSASSVKIDKWCDYEGEQLQIELESGDILLTSSFMLDLVNGGSASINATSLAKDYAGSNGKTIDTSHSSTDSVAINKDLIDTEYGFNYALKVVGENVTIIPLKSWKDYYNTDGNEDIPNSPNCELLQLTLPDDSVVLTNAYNTTLVKAKSDITSIAELFRGQNGKISNITSIVGEPNPSIFNKKIFDFNYKFEYAVLANGSTSLLFPISKWTDYSDGEQVQVKFEDGSGMLTTFVDTTLVHPNTEGLESVLTHAFDGTLESEYSLGMK